MNLGTNDLMREAKRQLEQSASRTEWFVVVVCLVGFIFLGVTI